MHAVGPHAGGDGPDAPDFPALRNPPAQGFSFPDEFHEFARPRYLHRKHDCAGGFHRLPGDSALICTIGIVVGIAMSYAARAFFLSAFPTLSILITVDWIVRSSVIAIVGGLLGASYPAW